MVLTALYALAASWLVQYCDTRFLLPLPAALWLAPAALAWFCAGTRAAVPWLAAGWTLACAGDLIATRLPDEHWGGDFLVRGTICDFPARETGLTRFLLQVEPGSAVPGSPRRLQVAWYDDAPALRPGQRWQLELRLRPPRGLRNPGGFDAEQWFHVRGIAASGYVRRSPLNRPLPPDAHACSVARVRGLLEERMAGALGAHPAAPYILGVGVGAVAGLRASDWELMRRTGTTHLLAISGFNIALVASPLLLAGTLLIRWIPALAHRPRAALLPALVAAAGYAALAGFTVSTRRALVMLGLVALVMLRRRRIEGIDLLAAAALAVVAADPASVVSVSFWLSFLAVAWLCMAIPAAVASPPSGMSFSGRWLSAAAGLCRAQFVLSIGMAPLTLAWFGQVSLVAPLANLIAVPVFSLLIIPATLLGAVMLFIVPDAGAALLGFAADAMGALLGGLETLARPALALWQPRSSTPAALLVAMAGAVLSCWWRPVPLRILAPTLFMPAVFGLLESPPPLRVTVLDVGQGLSVLLRTRSHAILYDAGPAYRERDAGESVVVPALRSLGVVELDALVVSHADQDHAGGAASVLAAWPRAGLIASGPDTLPGRPFQRCRAGQGWAWDGVRFMVVSPDEDNVPRSDNDGSCVLRVEAGTGSVLLTGDIGRDREAYLARTGALGAASLVLAPHHGSRSSSGAALVTATHPQFVVFSAAERNRWGFPAVDVVARWVAAGACPLGTASAGALSFTIDHGGRLHLTRSERLDARHLWSAPGAALPACARPRAR